MTNLMVYVNRRLLGQQRDKLFREALRMQLAQAGENLKALREIADALIAEAKAGNIQAIKELADRLDGKPVQMLEHTEGAQPTTRRIVREIVHVTETREELEQADLIVDFHEIRTVNGNGHG
jgi:ribosomal protein L17